MDSIFSFKRFVKYLGYDIVNAKNYFGISLLICGLMPAIVYLIFALFSLVFTGNVQGGGGFAQITSICISMVVVILCFPAKVYGSVTERRAGSSWTLLPASVFEKWLSMLVVCCVVLPLCFGVLFFGVDGIMSLIVKGYPSPAINFLIDFKRTLSDFANDHSIMDLHIDYSWLLVLGWFDSILVYLLGAVFFKKSKIAKTILVLFALSMVASVFLGSWINSGHVFVISSEMNLDEINFRLDRLNAFTYGYYIAIFVIVNVLIYLRLKTIKH